MGLLIPLEAGDPDRLAAVLARADRWPTTVTWLKTPPPWRHDA
jgi:hypothetical protein